MIFGVILFALWQTQILHRLVHADEWILPTPSHIGEIIGDNLPKLFGNLIMTTIPVLIGLALGSFLGFLIALLAVQFRRWGKGGLAVVSCFNAIPIVALAPVFNNLVKVFITDIQVRGIVSKFLVVTVMCISSMSFNAYRGLTELQPFGEDLMRTYAADRKTVFFKLRLPNCLPFIFTALKVSLPVSIISALVSEYFKMTLSDIYDDSYIKAASASTDGKFGTPEKSSVKIQLKWLPQSQFMGYYVANALGYYKEVGLDVEIVSGGGDIGETTAVSNGTVDFGVTWVSNLITANAGGMNLLEIAQVYQRSGLVLVYKINK